MFPSLSSPKKDIEYHKSWGRSILTSSITDSWALSYRAMAEAYKYFMMGSSGDMTRFLQTAEDGNALPAIWLSISGLKSKIEGLVGEMEQRGFDIRVKALNKEATSRKLEEKERLRVERKLQATAKFAQSQTGLPLQEDENIPQTDRELDEYIDLGYKDKAEIIMEAALKYNAKRNKIEDIRNKTFFDLWIANKVITRNEIVRGLSQYPRVDPLCFIYDRHATKDDLSDATYFGEVYYMGLGEAAERYNLTQEELEQANNAYNQFIGTASQVLPIANVAGGDNFFDSIPNGNLGWFKNIDNIPRVLVTRCVWSDFKIRKYKSETNKKYGTEHLQEITEDIRDRGKSPLITKKFNVWRQVTLIGGTIVREWGECPNQAREIDSLETTQSPYNVWCPNFLLGTSVSKVEQVVKLDLLRDIAMYNLHLAMNRGGSKGFVYDLALKPENMTLEQVLGYLKTSGILPVNSKEYQMTTGGMNVLKELDLSISQGINQYMEIMSFLDSQINSILGSSAERQGSIPVASQAVGVTQAAIAGSTTTTQPYFSGFERFWSRVLNNDAKLIKIAWANSDRELFAPIIGDTGIDFLKDNIDIDLDTFGVFCESLPPLLGDRAKLEQLIMTGVQSQQISIADALAILLEPDTKLAYRLFQRKELNRQKLQAQQEQAQQQAEADQADKYRQMQIQNQQTNWQGQGLLQQQKNQGATERTLIGSRTKLQGDKLKLLSQ